MKIIRPLMHAATIAAIALPVAAIAAPRPWVLPSETMFAGTGNEWLTVDAAISTDLFNVDHPGQDWTPTITAPDGSDVKAENRTVGKLRETFDVPVTMPGTYRISINNVAVMGSYVLNGETKRLPRGTTPATLAAAIPAGATDVHTAKARTRIETFVSAGEPSSNIFKPTGEGMEMVPVTHPNDVVAGEPASFRFLLDGKPAAGMTVTAIAGGVRYRQALNQIDVTTDADGKATLTLPDAGMYWVSIASGRDRKPEEGEKPGPDAAPPAPQDRATYAMTIEVQN